MKKLLFLLLAGLSVCEAYAQVHVKGYYRSNGTYVQPHYRSSPDGNPYNNWSYPGNVNPYTGKVASGNPDTYLQHYYNRSTNSSPSTSYPNSYYSPSTYSGFNNTNELTSSFSAHVTAQKLNVRLSATSTSPVVAVIPYETKVEILDQTQAPWYYITAEYVDPKYGFSQMAMGYVHSNYLSINAPSTIYSTPATPNFMAPSTNYSAADDPIGEYYVATSSLEVHAAATENSGVLMHLPFKKEVAILSASDYPWYWIRVSYVYSTGHDQCNSYGYAYGPDLATEVPVNVRSSAMEKSQTTSTVTNPTQHPYGVNEGKINFWSNVPNDTISLYVDYVHEGELTTYFHDQPGECGANGMISIIAAKGEHLLQAIGRNYHWSGYFIIHADKCDMFKISSPGQ